MVDKKLYNCVLSQIFSPCQQYLICGCIYGDVAVFDLKSILNDETPDKEPKHIFPSPNKEQICSLASTKKFLIIGTVGSIFGYDWETIKDLKPTLSWTINLPTSNDKLLKTDINSMFVKDDSQLYAGCGDNMIYSYSLEDGRMTQKFKGHTNYIHSISCFDKQMASAGEDGSVRLWDMRQSSMIHILYPYKNAKLSRPHFGNWIGDVDITGDWLVCGGGPGLGLWHMRTLELMSTFGDTDDCVFHITKLRANSILATGSGSHFYQLKYTGEVRSKLETSACTVYSALYSSDPSEVLTLGGERGNIDICTNFTYRHQVINFYP